MILLDTSALAKLLVDETESGALREELAAGAARGGKFMISTLATIELRRLAIRLSIDTSRIEPVLQPFRTLRLTEGMLQLAGRIPYRQLGTLDAVHIATALTAEASALVSYDTHQVEAARAEGLAVLSPGRA